jgi:hypothetical protein
VGVFAWAEVHRPVNQVEIEVFKLKLGKSIVESSLNVRRIMLGVPELGRDEDVLTLEARNVGEGTLNSLGDFFLVFVAVIGGLTRQLASLLGATAPPQNPTTEGQLSL